MDLPPSEWEHTADEITEEAREAFHSALEAVAKRAAMLAAYMDQRAGFGYGDMKHTKALKEANRVGRLLWVKGFGYYDFHDLRI